ncbi:MAG: hypothetical protein P8Z50_01245, partial [candidate division WOR-3 bacterium]
TFGTASVNATTGCIEVAYTTDDTVTTDVITTELVSNGTRDYDTVHTVGGAPTGMYIYAGDTTTVVGGIDGYASGKWEYLSISLYDQYGNQTVWSDYYGEETHLVTLSVSEGGGHFRTLGGAVVELKAIMLPRIRPVYTRLPVPAELPKPAGI